MTNFFNEKRSVFFLLISFFLFFLLLTFFSEGTFDAGDGIRHYLISRYSWNHPGLFLDSWGKPFFTLVSSPFSQFGLYGTTVFNIVCGIASSYLVYRIAKKMNYKPPVLAIPFLLFAPIYFPTMNSGLTEPFFGLVLILSILLMIEKRYRAAAILISFLPFVRTEGFLFLPLFFIVLVYYKSFIPALLLSFGTVVYSIIGFFYFGDFLWIKTQNPYNGSNKDTYGSGELFSFAEKYDVIWGVVLAALLVLGVLLIIIQIFFKRKDLSEKKTLSSFINIEATLILGCFIVFFAAHSIMWWKGLANSMGLVRVFAGVIPCSTLICLKGFNLLTPDVFLKNRFIKGSAIAVLLFFVVLKPFQSEHFPFKLSQEQVLVKEAADWMKAEGYDKRKLYYLYPYLPLLLDIDAFDFNKAADLWGLYPHMKKEGVSSIPDGTIVFWDAHFGPNECGIPLDTIMNDPNFDLIKTFYPKERFTVLGGFPFTISVFVKRDVIKKKELLKTQDVSFDVLNTEGNKYILSEKIEYGQQHKRVVSDLPIKTKRVSFSGTIVDPKNNSKNALVVLVIDNADGNNIVWEGKPLLIVNDSINEKRIDLHFNLNAESFRPTDILKIYIWNKDKKYFYLFDCKIFYWVDESCSFTNKKYCHPFKNINFKFVTKSRK